MVFTEDGIIIEVNFDNSKANVFIFVTEEVRVTEVSVDIAKAYGPMADTEDGIV